MQLLHWLPILRTSWYACILSLSVFIVTSGHCMLKTATSFCYSRYSTSCILILCKMICIKQPPTWNKKKCWSHGDHYITVAYTTILALQITLYVNAWGERGEMFWEKRYRGWFGIVKSETVSKLCEHSLVLREPGYKAKATYKYMILVLWGTDHCMNKYKLERGSKIQWRVQPDFWILIMKLPPQPFLSWQSSYINTDSDNSIQWTKWWKYLLSLIQVEQHSKKPQASTWVMGCLTMEVRVGTYTQLQDACIQM